MEQTIYLKIDLLSSSEVIPMKPSEFTTPVFIEWDDEYCVHHLLVPKDQLLLLISELNVKVAQVIRATDPCNFFNRDTAQSDGLYSLYYALCQATELAHVLFGTSKELMLSAIESIERVIPINELEESPFNPEDIYTNNPSLKK